MKGCLNNIQDEVHNVMTEKGDLIRWEGGFWTYKDAKIGHILKDVYHGDLPVPEWYCGIRTLRSMKSKGWVTLDEQNNICSLISV